MTLLADDPGLLPLYDHADIVLADGWPVARILSHQARRSWARATGADLLEGLFAGRGAGRPLVIVGGENSLELRGRLSERATQSGWRPLFEPARLQRLETHCYVLDWRMMSQARARTA
jgi:N-acetylglucosaminyldiphosphoundecaprenol N-acetyl-beta-D-mannosaminyltransferase